MITVSKLNQEGQTVTTYTGEVERRQEDCIVIKAIWQHGSLDLGYTTFEQGDIFIEYYYDDRWYNIFEIRNDTGDKLKGWYCNITQPPRITAETIAWQDLWLDVWVDPDGRIRVLDEDEFAANVGDATIRAAAHNAREELCHAVRCREAPFDQIATVAGGTSTVDAGRPTARAGDEVAGK